MFVKFLGKNLLNILWVLLSVLNPYISRGGDLVAILDVGQGDSILIQEDYFQILIDGGPDISVLYSISNYMPLDDRRIEILILTHPHDDHIYGLLEIIKRYDIGEVWLYPVCFENDNYIKLFESGVKLRTVYKGFSFNNGDIFLDVLWPNISDSVSCSCGRYSSWDGNINNDSLIIKLYFLEKEFLFMGDAEKPVEKELIDLDIVSDVLKVGHHCSSTSSSETFVKMVSPHVAICSCSEKNKFGHPDRGTLNILEKYKVQIYKTYEYGDVVFR